MKNVPPPPILTRTGVRKSRSKAHQTWSKANEDSQGKYYEIESKLAVAFPTLSKAELRVCVLVLEKIESHQIADVLAVSEHTIENHRYSIRKKLNIDHSLTLSSVLLSLLTASK